MKESELLEILKNHADSGARRQAVESLMGNKVISNEAIEVLASSINDEDSGVTDSICRILSNLSGDAAKSALGFILPNIKTSDIRIRNIAAEIIKVIGRDYANLLIPYFSEPDPVIRQFAVEIASAFDNDIIINKIKEMLDDPNENVRSSAIEAVGYFHIEGIDEILIKRYDYEEDLKSSILFALGNIQTPSAEDFLLSSFKSSEDVFIKLTCLDMLSVFSKNEELANELFENYDFYPESIHTVLLKTIYSIFERLGKVKALSQEMRIIARNAIFEDDRSISYYGVISLGNFYTPDDIPALASEIFKENPITQKIILKNIIINSNSDIISYFIDELVRNIYTVGSEVNLISFIPELYNENPLDFIKFKNFQNIMIDKIIADRMIVNNIIFDVLEMIDKNNFNERLGEFLNSNGETKN